MAVPGKWDAWQNFEKSSKSDISVDPKPQPVKGAGESLKAKVISPAVENELIETAEDAPAESEPAVQKISRKRKDTE